MHWLAGLTPKSANYQYIKLCQLSKEAIREGAKIILKLPYLTQRWDLIRNQTALLSRQNLVKSSLIQIALFDSALSKIHSVSTFKGSSADRWSTSERLKSMYNLLNSNYGRFFGENKEHLLNTKNCKNLLKLILGALFSRSLFTLCWTSACQTSSADFKSY